MTYILKKTINLPTFEKYLATAQETNQFSNGGAAVAELESRAREMLGISDTKSIIACSSGTAAIHAILFAYMRHEGKDLRVSTQDFTFPSNSQGPATGPIVVDIDGDCNFNLEDEFNHQYADIMIVTNCFGHIQELDKILLYAQLKRKKVILDNAASPYSFYNGTNISNLGGASYISLHHTKHIGFGEGGLAIIDHKYETQVRTAINFGLVEGQFNERGSNFKMSEIAAAAILQYWDSFDIKDLREKLLNNYYDKLFELNQQYEGTTFPNYADDEGFLPSCLPYVFNEPKTVDEFDEDCKKYYHPLRGMPVSKQIYDRIICFPITEGIND